MKAELLQTIRLEGIPSASALAQVGGQLWVAGDDSPWLFCVDRAGKTLHQVKLFDHQGPRIPKPQKPDLESMAVVGQEDGMLLFGSGSKLPTRSVVVFWPTGGQPQVIQAEVFYRAMMAACGINEDAFNLEGATCRGWDLELFNRGTNQIIGLNGSHLVKHLLHDGPLPEMNVRKVELGEKGGFPIGFSGASHLDRDRVLFSASVEATDNWIDDGEVLGSYIGVLTRKRGRELVEMAPVMQEGQVYTGKIEAVELAERLPGGRFRVWAVTDDDKGGSDLLLIEVEE